MCGITGFLGGDWSVEVISHRLKAMTDAILSRGPDSHGQWLDVNAGIGLGHRRLSIVELSPCGR